MSFLGDFTGSAAEAGAGIIGSQIATDQATAAANQRSQFDSDLATARAKTIQALKDTSDINAENRAIANRDAPLNRISELAKQKLAEQVPVEAKPVTTLSGQDPQLAINPEGATSAAQGMSGNYAALRAQAANLPPEDQAPYLAQLERQFAADTQSQQASSPGQTRARTPDEAFNAALEDAKINDPVAYAAGRPLSADKTLTVADGSAIIDPKSGRVIFQNNGKAERQSEIEDRKDARARDAEEARDRRQLAALSSAEARAAMSAGGKPPSGYRVTEDNNLEFIKGGPADPSTKEKPLPGTAAKGLLDNQQNLRRAQKALALVQGLTVDDEAGDKSATGKKGWVPNQILNRMDPAGIATRAAIADLGSLVVHDRSGAAVTASEFPRLAPFIPTEKDDATTVEKKLSLFVKNYAGIIDDATEFYRDSGYKVPTMASFEVDKVKAMKNKPEPGNNPGWSNLRVN